MQRVAIVIGATAMALGVAAGSAATMAQGGGAQTGSGWQLPADADAKKSPLTVDAKVVASGRAVFKDKCVKCHGASGIGDGPDADPEHREDMDLTNAKRADRNPDGVVFYKVANGRKRPKMPAFKDELNEQQIWSVVAYVQTLRKK
jgi:mono/diheme cytochrome c family protein